MKEFGKTKIYHAPQADEAASPEQLAAMDAEVARLTQEKQKLSESLQALKGEASKLLSEPDDQSLDNELATEEKAVAALSKKLDKLKKGDDAMSRSEVDALQKQFNTYITEWKRRRKACLEFCAMFGEMSQAKSWTVKKFITDRGLDTDESVEANIDDWLKLVREVKDDAKPAKGKGKAKR